MCAFCGQALKVDPPISDCLRVCPEATARSISSPGPPGRGFYAAVIGGLQRAFCGARSGNNFPLTHHVECVAVLEPVGKGS